MVLESIISPESAEASPLKIVVLSFVFVTLGIWIAQFVQIKPISIMAIVFVVLPSVPFLLNLYNFDEAKAVKTKVLGSRTLARHLPIIMVLLSYFVGLTIGFTFWYLVLPPDQSSEVFSSQISELGNISQGIQVKLVAKAVESFSGKITGIESAFEYIFLHNLGVLLLIIVFSVLYGAGAAFILAWNASIIAVFIGNVAQKFVFHSDPSIAVLAGAGYGALGLLPHGTFELLSYQTGGLAGGILSSAILRKVYKTPEFKGVLKDVVKLIAWAIVFLAIGALIEGNALAMK